MYEYAAAYFSNFGSLKSTETMDGLEALQRAVDFSNFGSLKSTETYYDLADFAAFARISAISAR